MLVEQSELNQLTITAPYKAELEKAKAALGATNRCYEELLESIKLAETSLASAKALYEELKALEEHEHNYIAVTTEATCTEDGYTTHTCKCGSTYVDTIVDALGHDWTEWTTTKEATQEEAGE